MTIYSTGKATLNGCKENLNSINILLWHMVNTNLIILQCMTVDLTQCLLYNHSCHLLIPPFIIRSALPVFVRRVLNSDLPVFVRGVLNSDRMTSSLEARSMLTTSPGRRSRFFSRNPIASYTTWRGQ